MKAILVVISIMMSASVYASEREETKCWFGGEGKDPTQCKVRLREDDKGLSTERVSLDVDCDCDFKLEDERAVQFDKGRDEYNLGTRDGKLALLVISGEALSEREQNASLIISTDHGRKTDATRLEGKCKKERRED